MLSEEKAQGTVEYILITGGLILSAIVIVAIYSRLTKSASERLETSTNQSTLQMQKIMESSISEME